MLRLLVQILKAKLKLFMKVMSVVIFISVIYVTFLINIQIYQFL